MSLFPPLLPLPNLDSFFSPSFGLFRSSFPPQPIFEFPLADDIADLGHALQVSVPNPGFPLANIHTKLEGNVLTIHGQAQNQHQANKEGYYSSRASQSSFTHRVKLPTDKLDSQQVKLRLNDTQMQLLIILPKK